MSKPKIVFSVAAFFAFCLLSLADCLAQTPPKNQTEPSYEIVLQTLVASNNTNNKTDVPQTLSGVIKKLKANYSYSDYRLVSTSLQRVANTGTVEFRSVTNETIPNQEKNFPVFSEWALSGLQNLPNAKGQDSVQFQSLRFGQRVPLINSIRDENGKMNTSANYEQIGLTIQRFSVAVNVPTVIGSLATSKPDELMFLILTVKSAEE